MVIFCRRYGIQLAISLWTGMMTTLTWDMTWMEKRLPSLFVKMR